MSLTFCNFLLLGRVEEERREERGFQGRLGGE